MKLLYTDIRNPLTQLLAKEAEQLVQKGKRVFYIAPNSLSFEKEYAVLAELPRRLLFQLRLRVLHKWRVIFFWKIFMKNKI